MLDFFKKLIPKKHPATPTNKKPWDFMTVKADPKLFTYYDIVFKQTMLDVQGISDAEKEQILTFIKQGDGEHLNQAHYFKHIHKTFFRNRNWTWNEYEKWERVFQTLGRRPWRFPSQRGSSTTEPTDLQVLERLTANNLKKLCADLNVSLPPKTKKAAIFQELLLQLELQNHPLFDETREEIKSSGSYWVFSCLMNTIASRASDLVTLTRGKELGIRYEIVHSFAEEAEFVDIALKENPNLLLPAYPTNTSSRKSILPF